MSLPILKEGKAGRLHDAKTYPGTGIDLSIVLRIISRYSGKIWAEGKPGKGACSFFNLP
ncbi:MAG: hypothetical protein ACQES4_01965 [Bacillota bacterium]